MSHYTRYTRFLKGKLEKLEISIDILIFPWYDSNMNWIVIENRCSFELNREVRWKAGTVPPLYDGANPICHWETGKTEELWGRVRRTACLRVTVCTYERWEGDGHLTGVVHLFPYAKRWLFNSVLLPSIFSSWRAAHWNGFAVPFYLEKISFHIKIHCNKMEIKWECFIDNPSGLIYSKRRIMRLW